MKYFILLVLFLLPVLVNACDYPDDQTTQCTASWLEPTENTDNSPLTDLAGVRVMCSLDNITFTKCADVPASSPNGGGQMSTPIIVSVAVGEKKTIYTYAIAYDTSGGSSEKSNVVNKEIDRLVPKPPTDFTAN